MMKPERLILLIFVLLILSLNSFNALGAGNEAPPDTEPRLVEALVFYRGYNVGGAKADRTNGPKVSADRGKTWTGMAWADLKCFSIDVSSDGRWVYVGAGPGVFVSEDGGRNWRLTGGTNLNEVLDAAIDPVDPHKAWASTAYGLYKTINAGKTWVKPGNQPFGYVSCVCIDKNDTDRIFIGTEAGFYITEDDGKTYEKTGPDAIIRSIIQDSRGNDRYWVGTDGDGLWLTNDGGKSWKRVTGAGEIINRVKQHPENPAWIFCGCDDGVRFSLDSGLSWNKGTSKDFGIDSAFYGIAFDLEDDRRIYGGCRDGFYESKDGGFTWKLAGQQHAVIQDIDFVNLYVGPEIPLSDEGIGPTTTGSGTTYYEKDDDPGFDARAEIGRRVIAEYEYGERINLPLAAAIIKSGGADEKLYDALRNTLGEPGHAMFWAMQSIMFYLHSKDDLPPDIADMVRYGLVENSLYRGDTENHWVMFHTAMLLSAQSWPYTPPSKWYNGHTSAENYLEAKGWLEEWFEITSTVGQGEFDSPGYYMFFIYPMLLLYDFVDDPDLQNKAGMMLDLLLADLAVDSLDGRFCGGHSRLYDRHVRSGDGSEDGDLFYIFFGGIDPPERFHSWSISALYGSYRCPGAIRDIAHRRDEPYVHTEIKRVRNIMRYADYPESPAYEYGGGMNPPVYKYNYMTSDYCLGSMQGGILQPIQQHTWDATWKGEAKNTVCFTLHPYWSGFELALFFPEDPHMLTSSVSYQKSGYTDEDKWTSSSPYERIFQLEDTLLAVYNVPESDVWPNHTDLFMPKCLDHETRSGWILGHDGEFYIGIRPVVPGEWREHEDYWRYTVPAGQTAFIVETGRAADDGEYEDFVDAVLSTPQPKFVRTPNGPEVHYTNRHGRKMAYIWDGDRRLMSDPVWEFPTNYLYKSPLVESEWGSGIIYISGDEDTRILNFNDWTVEEIGNLFDP